MPTELFLVPPPPDAPGPPEPADGSPTPAGHRSASRRDAWRAALRDRLPLALRGARLDPGPAALAAVAVLALAVALGSLVVGVHGRPARAAAPAAAVAPPGAPVTGGGDPQAVTPAASPAPGLLVDVVGAVTRPGLVRLPAGARVADALAAAGGAKPGVTTDDLNLARPLVDGEQLRVGLPLETAVPGPGTGAAPGRAAPAASRVSLSLASVSQLDTLPGLGPALAQRIVDYRTAHGRFTSVDQLAQVPGIGDRKLAELRALVVP